ncbi:hypothetical protein CUMW_034540 [Citrus unshiu]|nr:hypothetical protein CUMW_034540 [Citrus unshiu]
MQWLNGSVRFSHSVRFIRLLSDSNSRTKLFIGGLSYDTNETVLKDAFGQHGEIIEVKVICDRVTGQSRGYGFVKFASEAAAGEAIKEMDGLKHSSELCAQGLILGLRFWSVVAWILLGWLGFSFAHFLFYYLWSNDATMQQLRLTRSTMQPNHFLNVDRQSFDYISDIIQAAM